MVHSYIDPERDLTDQQYEVYARFNERMEQVNRAYFDLRLECRNLSEEGLLDEDIIDAIKCALESLSNDIRDQQGEYLPESLGDSGEGNDQATADEPSPGGGAKRSIWARAPAAPPAATTIWRERLASMSRSRLPGSGGRDPAGGSGPTAIP